MGLIYIIIIIYIVRIIMRANNKANNTPEKKYQNYQRAINKDGIYGKTQKFYSPQDTSEGLKPQEDDWEQQARQRQEERTREAQEAIRLAKIHRDEMIQKAMEESARLRKQAEQTKQAISKDADITITRDPFEPMSLDELCGNANSFTTTNENNSQIKSSSDDGTRKEDFFKEYGIEELKIGI